MTRVRFAPSPTGDLHVGGARTAFFNWLLARKTAALLSSAWEDTDGARNTAEASEGIVKGLRWLGLDWDEGPEAGGDCSPYYQSQRKDIYDAYLAKLEAAGRVYTEEGGAVRFKFSRTAITVHDLVCGDVTFAPTEEPDMTIRRPDGSYIFHFVNVVDDIEMKHDARHSAARTTSPTPGSTSTSSMPSVSPRRSYAHIPLILNPDGSKMSKRDAGSAIEHSYMNEGFLPDAVFNYLCTARLDPACEKKKYSVATSSSLFSTPPSHSQRQCQVRSCKSACGLTRSICVPSAPGPCFKQPHVPSSTAKGLTPSPTKPCRHRGGLTV
jgi:glutamyl/glutaminyl-tRNA synthetase